MPHVNTLRRSRGYGWEKLIVNFINSQEGYQARRLGGSSTGFPDIVITHNESGTIYAIEAKSVTTQAAYVPDDQIERCLKILHMFGWYPNKVMWFAFKFGRNKSTIQDTKRKLNDKTRYYFFKINSISYLKNIRFAVCDVNGNLSIMPKNANDEQKPNMTATKFEKMSDMLVHNSNSKSIQTKLS